MRNRPKLLICVVVLPIVFIFAFYLTGFGFETVREWNSATGEARRVTCFMGYSIMSRDSGKIPVVGDWVTEAPTRKERWVSVSSEDWGMLNKTVGLGPGFHRFVNGAKQIDTLFDLMESEGAIQDASMFKSHFADKILRKLGQGQGTYEVGNTMNSFVLSYIGNLKDPVTIEDLEKIWAEVE